jgi:hypothetical protein
MLEFEKPHDLDITERCARSTRQGTKSRWPALVAITSLSTAFWMLALVAGSYGLGTDIDERLLISFGLVIALIVFIGAAIVVVS